MAVTVSQYSFPFSSALLMVSCMLAFHNNASAVLIDDVSSSDN